jgi:hypothetical protein
MYRGLQDLPVFNWWVKHTIKKKECMINAVWTRYLKRKCGLRIPKAVEEAYEIDRETGTDFWHKAIIQR